MKSKIIDLWNYRNLIQQMTYRDIMLRYKGSFLGFAWSAINPLIMLLIYSFIFIAVFKLKWGVETEDNKLLYTLMIFSGLVPFNIFSESVNRSLGLISSNPNYVKKVVFPIEILPISLVFSTIINGGFSLVLLVLGKIVFMSTPNWTLLYLPLLILPLLLFSLGLSLALSALGTYIRDLTHTIALIINVMFYMSPIFYQVSAVPQPFQKIIFINPLTYIIEEWRNVILLGNPINFGNLAIMCLFSFLVFIFGYWIFHYLRKGFADVI